MDILMNRIHALEKDLASAVAVRDLALECLSRVQSSLNVLHLERENVTRRSRSNVALSNLRSIEGRDAGRVQVMRQVNEEIEVQGWIGLTKDMVFRGLLPDGVGAVARGVEDDLTRKVAGRGCSTLSALGGSDEVDVIDGQDVAHG